MEHLLRVVYFNARQRTKKNNYNSSLSDKPYKSFRIGFRVKVLRRIGASLRLGARNRRREPGLDEEDPGFPKTQEFPR